MTTRTALVGYDWAAACRATPDSSAADAHSASGNTFITPPFLDRWHRGSGIIV
jgi:hypothetical protein